MPPAQKLWRRMNEGVLGYVFYIVLGMVAAIVVTNVLGLALDTSVPLVAVLSGSMDHGINDELGSNKYPCSNNVGDYRESFENWWELCGQTYDEFGITKQEFAAFPYSDGLKKGDIVVLQNLDGPEVGDIIVYDRVDVPQPSVPIIHRVVVVDRAGENGDSGALFQMETYQTKGDHNAGQNSYEKSIQKSQVRGKAIFVVPYLGYLRVLLPIN